MKIFAPPPPPPPMMTIASITVVVVVVVANFCCFTTATTTTTTNAFVIKHKLLASSPSTFGNIQYERRRTSSSSSSSSSVLSMVLETPPSWTAASASAAAAAAAGAVPPKKKKLAKIEQLKIDSDYLRHPLKEQLKTEEISVSKDAYQILKYHGSYQQTNREIKGRNNKAYQFMLRLKQPSGELSANLYRLVDDLSNSYGQGDLRATTRQCFQIHGILKGNLKTVISSIMNIGSSTIGACGDVSRNVMCTPAPFVTPEYQYAREWSKIVAQLFKPMSPTFSEIWLDGEKAASVETWSSDISSHQVESKMLHDSGTGIIVQDSTEPLYGNRYLPRKFKVVFTVPGDNSVDIYTNDIGCVVITNPSTGKLEGFNVMVGGGMGRTHNKENTFPRAADHLGFVSKDDAIELFKSILAAQRDHGNRDIRANARMKYLVHTLGITNFRKLVESYFGKSIEPWKDDIQEWKYNDWMGWYEQGDGKLFYGLHVENGRVKDDGEFKLKSGLRALVDKYNYNMILSPTQSLIIHDIDPKDKEGIDLLLQQHGLQSIENVDPLNRLAMSCPALPLCGLAQTEAERLMPSYLQRIRTLLNKLELQNEEIVIRMTGCPNGCARPYMAELAFVGDGPKSYQIWLGGSPVLTRTAFPYMSKMNVDDLEATLEPILKFYKENRIVDEYEAFGDFCYRVGPQAIENHCKSIAP